MLPEKAQAGSQTTNNSYICCRSKGVLGTLPAEIIPYEPEAGNADEGIAAHRTHQPAGTPYIYKCISMVPVQFITHQTARFSYEESALLALRGGCRWIQLRMKEATDDEMAPVAERLREACTRAGATFVVDDRVELAKDVKADGVHLGKNDMPVREARSLLGESFIIGGTANTLDDIERLWKDSADYAGCGPLRFTVTKKNLAPLLGLDGYRAIVTGMRERGIRLPLCAIGGITPADVRPLLDAGVQGIAVSGYVLSAPDPAEAMHRLLNCDQEETEQEPSETI